VPVVHCYGHAGAGYQSSWYVCDDWGEGEGEANMYRGTAERVLEIVQKTLEPGSKL
jgi:D-amino-acid oxidase